MAGWVEVVATAFTLQLLALPGEKGQFVVAALATKYDPYLVVAGASTAFGGWTLVEVLVGEALSGALPEVYLDAGTAVLFVAFAAWLLVSDAGEEDAGAGTDSTEAVAANGGRPRLDDLAVARGLEDRGVAPLGEFGGFLSAFSAMALAEFGDKTQLVTIGLAAQYGAHAGIWVGEMLAIVPVSLLTALFAHRFAQRLNARWVVRVAAATFLLFAADIAAGILLGRSVLPL